MNEPIYKEMDEKMFKFLMEVFEECNAHIRATDRKSLVLAGSFLTLFSVYFTSFTIGTVSRVEVGFSSRIGLGLFFLLAGSFIALIKEWYRIWKEHYLDVCKSIRVLLFSREIPETVLPSWLRQDSSPDKTIGADSLLKLLIHIANVILITIIASDVGGHFGYAFGIVTWLALLGLYYAGVFRQSKNLRDRVFGEEKKPLTHSSSTGPTRST